MRDELAPGVDPSGAIDLGRALGQLKPGERAVVVAHSVATRHLPGQHTRPLCHLPEHPDRARTTA